MSKNAKPASTTPNHVLQVAIGLHEQLAFDALDRCHNYMAIPCSPDFRKWFTLFAGHLAFIEVLQRRAADG